MVLTAAFDLNFIFHQAINQRPLTCTADMTVSVRSDSAKDKVHAVQTRHGLQPERAQFV